MALFGRKQQSQDDVRLGVATMARHQLAELGFETTIDLTTDPVDPRLLGADGWTYPLYNLIVACSPEPRRKWSGLIENHIAKLVGSRANVPAEELDPEMLRRQIRTRLLSSNGDDRVDFSYARQIAPGLMLVLCIDYPDTVQILGRSTVDALAYTEAEAYRVGQSNTNAESVDDVSEIAPGVWMISGESLFIASKIADLSALESTIGPAPDGIVFAAPHRGALMYVKPDSRSFAASVQALLGIVDGMAQEQDAGLPGGLISSAIYYVKDGEVDVVGGRAVETNALHVMAIGRFGELLEKWAPAED